EEVETDIGIFLEKPQFAHLFHGNAAGSEVGDGSVFEFNSGIADVGGIAHHRNAAGADEFHFRVYQTQRQIEVVDHQIENDRNVRSSWIKKRQAMRFDEHGIQRSALQSEKGGVETFDMTDLDFHAFRSA